MNNNSQPPAFFIPGCNSTDPEYLEKVYSEIMPPKNEGYGITIPPISERVYSLTFRNDGEEFVATVGKLMERIYPRKATVYLVIIAIFSARGTYYVYNNENINKVGSGWEQYITTGNAKNIVYFSSSVEAEMLKTASC